MLYGVLSSYAKGGIVPPRYGVACAFAVLLSLIGVVLALYALQIPDTYRFFGILGLIISGIALLFGGFLLWIPV